MKTALEKKHPYLDVTERTVRNELSRLGYAAVLPKRVPLLTQKAKEIRLKWARDHRRYNWHNVVFSDETTIQLFRNTCLAWSRDKTPVTPIIKHSLKVHVWAAISVYGEVGMFTFVENMDCHLYRKILKDHLYTNADRLYMTKTWVFQQDNDPKHTSKDVQKDLKEHLPGRWPSYSPDLNPIENVWAVLKHKSQNYGYNKKSD